MRRKKQKPRIFMFFHHVAQFFWLYCLWAMLLEYWNDPLFEIRKTPEGQNYGWTTEGTIHWVKEMFHDDINEILVFDEYDKEVVNGENCESNEEGFWTDILEQLVFFRLFFASIIIFRSNHRRCSVNKGVL